MGVVVQWVKPLLRKPTSHTGGLGFKSGYCTCNLISTNMLGRTTVPEPLPPTWETHLRFRTPHLAWPSPGCCWPSGSQPATGRSLLCLSLPLETVLTSNTVGHTSSQKQEGKKARNSIVAQGAPGIRPDSIPESADARRHWMTMQVPGSLTPMLDWSVSHFSKASERVNQQKGKIPLTLVLPFKQGKLNHL